MGCQVALCPSCWDVWDHACAGLPKGPIPELQPLSSARASSGGSSVSPSVSDSAPRAGRRNKEG